MVLSQLDRRIISCLQQGIPLVKEPYQLIAQRVGISQEELLDRMRQYDEQKLIRRVAVVLDHNKIGLKANALVCWQATEEEIDKAGQIMASFPQVTHCYLRATNNDWSYNLFTMIHSQTKNECERIIKEIADKTGLHNYKRLYTRREFKKAAMRY